MYTYGIKEKTEMQVNKIRYKVKVHANETNDRTKMHYFYK